MEFCRQEYWGVLPFPSSGDLPNGGIEPASLTSPALAGGFFITLLCGKGARNQGKLEVVKQEMARVNIDILGISELKWAGMGEFNSDDHYIYYCG